MRAKKKRNPKLADWCPWPGVREQLYHRGLFAKFEDCDEPINQTLAQLVVMELAGAIEIAEDIVCTNQITGETVTIEVFKRPCYTLPSFN